MEQKFKEETSNSATFREYLLYNAEIGILRKADHKYLESFKI
jgi:hypothetical protein